MTDKTGRYVWWKRWIKVWHIVSHLLTVNSSWFSDANITWLTSACVNPEVRILLTLSSNTSSSNPACSAILPSITYNNFMPRLSTEIYSTKIQSLPNIMTLTSPPFSHKFISTFLTFETMIGRWESDPPMSLKPHGTLDSGLWRKTSLVISEKNPKRPPPTRLTRVR